MTSEPTEELCAHCKGSGNITVFQRGDGSMFAHGRFVESECPRCDGTGKRREPTAETTREAIDDRAAWLDLVQDITEEQPRYTIDQIVDGLRLEWVKDANHEAWWATTSITQFGIWENCGTYFASPQVDDEVVIESDSLEESQQKMLADYRQRFRAELERAVKHG